FFRNMFDRLQEGVINHRGAGAAKRTGIRFPAVARENMSTEKFRPEEESVVHRVIPITRPAIPVRPPRSRARRAGLASTRLVLECLEDRTLLDVSLMAGANVNVSKLKGSEAEGTMAIDPSDATGKRLFSASVLSGRGLFAAYSTDA